MAPLTVLAFPARANRARNPYNERLYAALEDLGVRVIEWSSRTALRERVDVVHVHWPEAHLNHRRWVRAAPRSARSLLLFAAARARGARLVWTVHNLASHERSRPRTEAVFWRAFVPMVDGWLALSDAAAGATVARFPALAARPHAVTPHGHYRGVYPDEVTRGEARDRLGVADAEAVIVFAGRIKAYKGVPALMRAFAGLDRPGARLVVAGRVETPELLAELQAAAARDPRVVLRPGVVPDDELQVVMRAADVVVAPFTDILNSGSVLLALSFDRPVLVPAIGSLPELRAAVGPEWVRTFEGELDAADLGAALDAAVPPLGGRPDLTAFEWAAIAEQTEALYRRVLGHEATPGAAASKARRT